MRVVLVMLVACAMLATSAEAVKPVCLFFHGLGQHGPTQPKQACQFNPSDPENAVCKTETGKRMKEYWGKLIHHVQSQDLCTPVFHFGATNHHSWSSETMTTDYCNAIRDTQASIVFTHSMGNVIVAAGVFHKVSKCRDIVEAPPLNKVGLHDFTNFGKVPAGKVVWFGTQGPLAGTPASTMCINLCKTARPTGLSPVDKTKYDLSIHNCGCDHPDYKPEPYPGTISLAPTYINPRWEYNEDKSKRLSLQFADGYCAALTQKETLKGVTTKGAQKGTDRGNWLEPSSVDLATPLKCTTVHEIAAKYMWGNLCGITSRSISGFPSTLGIAAAQIQKHAGWGVDEKTDPDKGTGNDGIVPYNSCVGQRKPDFQWTATSPFFSLMGNHYDGAGRYGDNNKKETIKLRRPSEAPDCAKDPLTDLTSSDVRLVDLDEPKSDQDVYMQQALEMEPATVPTLERFASKQKVERRPIAWFLNMILVAVPRLTLPDQPEAMDVLAQANKPELLPSGDLLYFRSSSDDGTSAPPKDGFVVLDEGEGCEVPSKKKKGIWSFFKTSKSKKKDKADENEALVPKKK